MCFGNEWRRWWRWRRRPANSENVCICVCECKWIVWLGGAMWLYRFWCERCVWAWKSKMIWTLCDATICTMLYDRTIVCYTAQYSVCTFTHTYLCANVLVRKMDRVSEQARTVLIQNVHTTYSNMSTCKFNVRHKVYIYSCLYCSLLFWISLAQKNRSACYNSLIIHFIYVPHTYLQTHTDTLINICMYSVGCMRVYVM